MWHRRKVCVENLLKSLQQRRPNHLGAWIFETISRVGGSVVSDIVSLDVTTSCV